HDAIRAGRRADEHEVGGVTIERAFRATQGVVEIRVLVEDRVWVDEFGSPIDKDPAFRSKMPNEIFPPLELVQDVAVEAGILHESHCALGDRRPSGQAGREKPSRDADRDNYSG